MRWVPVPLYLSSWRTSQSPSTGKSICTAFRYMPFFFPVPVLKRSWRLIDLVLLAAKTHFYEPMACFGAIQCLRLRRSTLLACFLFRILDPPWVADGFLTVNIAFSSSNIFRRSTYPHPVSLVFFPRHICMRFIINLLFQKPYFPSSRTRPVQLSLAGDVMEVPIIFEELGVNRFMHCRADQSIHLTQWEVVSGSTFPIYHI